MIVTNPLAHRILARPGVLIVSAILAGSTSGASVLAQGSFPASGVDLVAHLDRSAFVDDFTWTHAPDRGNEVWGYVSPTGREYALMGFSDRTAFVDITDAESPVVVAMHGHPREIWSDIGVHDEYAYVVTDGSGVGVQIFDLRFIDEGIVSLASIYDHAGGRRFATSHSIKINSASERAYLCGGNELANGGLVVLDISRPDRPELAGLYGYQPFHDIHPYTYEDGPNAGREIVFAFAQSAGLTILEITDSESGGAIITPLAESVPYDGLTYAHQGWLSEDGRYLFVGDELDEPGVITTRTYVFDVQDLTNPIYLHHFTSGLPATDHNLMVRGPFVFEANYRSGLRIFDATNIDEIVEVGWFDTHPTSDAAGYDGAWGVFTQFPSGLVVVSDMARGLFVLDPVAARAPVFSDEDAPEFPDGPGRTQAASIVDADGDGSLTLHVSHDVANRLYRVSGDAVSDITTSPLDDSGNGQAAVWGDMDNDGDLDLYLVNEALANRLLRNDGGAVFTDVTTAPLDDAGSGRGAAWFDVDRDGDLDILLANIARPPSLFRNDGAGVFTSIGVASGLTESIRGLGVAVADYDADGWPDLAIAGFAGDSRIYRQIPAGGFERITGGDAESPDGSATGVSWVDFDRDGDLDLYRARYEQVDQLLRNDGGIFTDVAGEMGLEATDGEILDVRWHDVDLDGWPDLLLADLVNGALLYRNDQGTRMVESTGANFPGDGAVHSLAVADVNDDGVPDVYAGNREGADHLYLGRAAAGAHWLVVKLEGTISNRFGVGARVELEVDGQLMVRHISAGDGHLGQDPTLAHFGTGGEMLIDRLRVIWPSGARFETEGVEIDQVLLISEVDATPIDDDPPHQHIDPAPHPWQLHTNVPNPFNPRTRIAFDLPFAAELRLLVIDAAGRQVRVLGDGPRAAGRHEVIWDGRDASGRAVGSGAYFYRLEGAGFTQTRRMTLIR